MVTFQAKTMSSQTTTCKLAPGGCFGMTDKCVGLRPSVEVLHKSLHVGCTWFAGLHVILQSVSVRQTLNLPIYIKPTAKGNQPHPANL